MERLTRHVLVPALMPLLFFAAAFTPVELIGCRNRGLLALLIALASGFWALGKAVVAARAGSRGEADAAWRTIGSLILAIPVVALLAMA